MFTTITSFIMKYPFTYGCAFGAGAGIAGVKVVEWALDKLEATKEAKKAAELAVDLAVIADAKAKA